MFSYSIPSSALDVFNSTCPDITSRINYVEKHHGTLLKHSLQVKELHNDCTTILLSGVEQSYEWYRPNDVFKNALISLKRFMHYGNKNSCICTTVRESVKDYLCGAGFTVVSEMPSSREGGYIKYTLLLEVPPKKIGYVCWPDVTWDKEYFSTDPYIKEYSNEI